METATFSKTIDGCSFCTFKKKWLRTWRRYIFIQCIDILFFHFLKNSQTTAFSFFFFWKTHNQLFHKKQKFGGPFNNKIKHTKEVTAKNYCRNKNQNTLYVCFFRISHCDYLQFLHVSSNYMAVWMILWTVLLWWPFFWKVESWKNYASFECKTF